MKLPCFTRPVWWRDFSSWSLKIFFTGVNHCHFVSFQLSSALLVPSPAEWKEQRVDVCFFNQPNTSLFSSSQVSLFTFTCRSISNPRPMKSLPIPLILDWIEITHDQGPETWEPFAGWRDWLPQNCRPWLCQVIRAFLIVLAVAMTMETMAMAVAT